MLAQKIKLSDSPSSKKNPLNPKDNRNYFSNQQAR